MGGTAKFINNPQNFPLKAEASIRTAGNGLSLGRLKMAEFKIVISDPKTGKSMQKEVKDEQARNLAGLKIGDAFKGEILDLTGYEFEITGGSDHCGFPMRKDVAGGARKKILAVKGVGIKNKKKSRGKDMKYMRTMKGMRQRKTVAGSTITDRTSQINVKILKQGKAEIFVKEEKPKEGEGKAPEAKAEAPKAEAKPEAPKEETKEEPEKEEKKPEKKKEAPKEKPKEEKKPEAKPKEEPKKEEKPGKRA